MAKNSRRITNQLGRSQVTGLVDKNNNNLLADSESDGYVSFDNVRIHGDLRVYGAQSIVNSSTLTISDKNIVLAKNAYDSDSYHNVGFTVADSDALFERGTSPSFQYNGQRDAWVANRKILINVNKENATDSDSLITQGAFETTLVASPTIVAIKNRLDSDDHKIQSLQIQVSSNDADISSLQSGAGTTSSTLSSLQTQITNNDGDISTLQGTVSTHTSQISSVVNATNTNTSAIAAMTFDSDSVVNMFNEYSLINTTADSDILKPLFRKVMNDFEIKDVSGNVVYSFFTRP
tara:strand:+ start:6288 stop:7163 length:876 start_codon:yes stop_codon:yes gene_type:complete